MQLKLGESEPDLISPKPVAATVWLAGEYRAVTDLENSEMLGLVEEARRDGGPVWFELALPNLDRTAGEWFEGSLNVWQTVETPEIDWASAEPVFDRLDLTPPTTSYRDDEPPETSLIRVLPHIWSRGILRAVKDLAPQLSLDDSARLFPTVGLWQHPEEVQIEEDEPWGPIAPITIIRTNVGVVRNCVITVRLPDLVCKGAVLSDGDGQPLPSRDLMIPERFLPFRQPNAREIAEAIAHHQAATARAVTEPLRRRLRNLERVFAEEAGDDRSEDVEEPPEPASPTRRARIKQRVAPSVSDDPRERAAEAMKLIDQMTEVLFSLDRQVSRLLRRFGSFGNDQVHAGGDAQITQLLRALPFVDEARPMGDRLIPREAKLRNEFALDELRALTADARLARDVIRGEAEARERDEREKFQFVAAIIGSVILFPSLIAGIYGANVELPGPRETGGWPLLLFVIGFGVLGFYFVHETWVRWPLSRDTDKLRVRALTAAGVVLAAALFLLIAISF